MSTASADQLAAWLKNKKGGAGAGAASTAGAAATKTTAATESGFFVSADQIEREWDLGPHPVEIISREMSYVSQSSGKTSIKIAFQAIAGSMKGACLDDYWPKEGKGLRKTHKACKAIGLVDAENNISIPGDGEVMLGRQLWIEIVPVEETFRDKTGKEQTRTVHKIDFMGYYPIDEFELPKEGDLFAEPGQVLPKEKTAPVNPEEAPAEAPADAPPSF